MPRDERIELAIILALIAVTLASFAAFGVDTLGIIVLSILLVCLGLFVSQR